jgi:hypothetical protein
MRADYFFFQVGRLFGKEYLSKKCGHKTKRWGIVSGGRWQKAIIELPMNEDGSCDFCLSCIGHMTRRCGVCAGPIFIGEQISWSLKRSAFKRAVNPKISFLNPDLTLYHCECSEKGSCQSDRKFFVPDELGKGIPGSSRAGYKIVPTLSSSFVSLLVRLILD